MTFLMKMLPFLLACLAVALAWAASAKYRADKEDEAFDDTLFPASTVLTESLSDHDTQTPPEQST